MINFLVIKIMIMLIKRNKFQKRNNVLKLNNKNKVYLENIDF